MTMIRPCECCEKGMTFIRMPPELHAEYRVECSTCGKFVKWGTQADYDRLDELYGDIPLKEYEGKGAGERIDSMYAGKLQN